MTQQLIDDLKAIHGDIISTGEIVRLPKDQRNFLFMNLEKAGHGKWKLQIKSATQSIDLSHLPSKTPAPPTPPPISVRKSEIRGAVFATEAAAVPPEDQDFVPFGDFSKIKMLIKNSGATGTFFTAFIAGHSGNGKTTFIEQACSQTNRKLVLVTVTEEIREADLFGSMRLVDGHTVFQAGPVVEAMRSGAVLLLDELTQGNPQRLMSLQNVLAGKAVFLKTTGEWIYPTPGFCVFATGNSKGDGDTSTDTRYIGEQPLNEAMSDRFKFTFEQNYPSPAVERRILMKKLAKITGDESKMTDFAGNLVEWANATRRAYDQGGFTKMITTRRLIDICLGYMIVGDRLEAIDLCLSRFDNQTKEAFRGMYFTFDEELNPNRLIAQAPAPTQEQISTVEEDITFASAVNMVTAANTVLSIAPTSSVFPAEPIGA